MATADKDMRATPRAMVFGRYDYASFLAYFAYAAASVAVPVSLVSVARDLNLRLENGGMAEAGALHVGRTSAIVVAMLLCGFWAGRWGKRHLLGLSIIGVGVGMMLCALAPTYSFLFVALVVSGLGEGIIEGLLTPFVQDLHTDEPGRYVNFTHAFWSVGVVVTVLLAGALLAQGVSWRFVLGLVACLALIPALLLLLPPRAGHEYHDLGGRVSVKTIVGQARDIVQMPRFWLFFAAMFVSGGGEFSLTFWCATYIQLNFASSAWIGGVGTACFAAGMVLGRTGWGYLLRQDQLRGLIVWSAVGGTLVTLCLPVVTHLWGFLFVLFLAGIATAPFWPSVQSLCADRLPGLDLTVLMILLACAGIPGCGAATWLMGYVGDHGGLSKGFLIAPACYLILGLLIAGEARWKPARQAAQR